MRHPRHSTFPESMASSSIKELVNKERNWTIVLRCLQTVDSAVDSGEGIVIAD